MIILFIPSHLRLCLLSGYWTKFIYMCFVSLVRAACLLRLNFHLTAPTRKDEDYNKRGSLLFLCFIFLLFL